MSGWETANRFRDRAHAGEALADRLAAAGPWPRPLVLALPRGGVPVAVPVAARLAAPLDVVLVRKVPMPGDTELAMGAVARIGPHTEIMRHAQVTDRAGIDEAHFREAVAAELASLDALAARLRPERPEHAQRPERPERPELEAAGRTAIVVDDGLATGATMTAAVRALRAAHPAAIVVAVPIGAVDACRQLTAEADEVVCLWSPEPFGSVSAGYRDFAPPTDEQVRQALS